VAKSTLREAAKITVLSGGHFLQLLGLPVVRLFKRHYGYLRRADVKRQLESNVLRVLHAWHSGKNAGCIDTGQRLGAIRVKLRSSVQGVLNIRPINQIQKENCQDGEDWLSTKSPGR
jgi:hypothetical protein